MISRFCPALILIYFLFFFYACISTDPAEPAASSSPVPAAETVSQDPGIVQIENELLLVYEYRDRTLQKINEIKQLVERIIPMIEQCKAPVNRMTPFIFSNTTIVPSDVLYRRHSIRPCEFYLGDTEIAGSNAGNHLAYTDSILTEVKNAENLVRESCADNGMSDYFKALVKNSLLSFRANAEAEINYAFPGGI